MSDPLGKFVTAKISELKYAKLHSPKMKSVYWKYFGFPTNENDRIITKQNVVCVVCSKVLTNHGNTTNLRAHLQHRHKDLFRQICKEHNIQIPPRRSQSKPPTASVIDMKREPANSKVKIEFVENTNDSSNAGSLTAEDHSMLYETILPITYDDDDDMETENFSKVDMEVAMQCNLNVLQDSKSDIIAAAGERKSNNYRMEMLDEVNTSMLQDALVDLVLLDLRNIDTLYDPGMAQLVRSLSGSAGVPAAFKIESSIRDMHNGKFFFLSSQLKMHTEQKPYSLGLETWVNVEQKQFLTIYFNYISEGPEHCLLNQLYCTHEYNKYTALDSYFEGFNLNNCTAVVLNNDYDDLLKAFWDSKDIPIIVSYDAIVDKCLRNIFAQASIAPIIDEIKDIIMHYSDQITSKDCECPVLNNDFPWSYYEYLKFFCETVSWSEDLEVLVTSARVIVDIIGSLVVTMETLRDEQNPHSSMISPITSKIIQKKLQITENEDELTGIVKTAIVEEMEKYVLEDDHLTIAALLDPRFHRLTSVLQLENCVKILQEKYKKISKRSVHSADGDDSEQNSQDIDVTSLTTTTTTTTNANTKRSNLELFFDETGSSSTLAPNQDNLEMDLQRYRKEVFASLDESPFYWWNKMGQGYGSLKKLATHYQCIPGVVNKQFKKSLKMQIQEHQKRFLLTGNLIDAILFLHHHHQTTSF